MRKKINIGKLLLLFMIPVIAISIYVISTRNTDNNECNEVDIRIKHQTEKPLLSEKNIYSILNLEEGKSSLLGRTASRLQLPGLEKTLSQHPSIKKAEVYMTLSGTLRMEIYEREPILRMMPTHTRGYYLDREMVKMPLSSNFTPDLIPVTGFVSDKMDSQLVRIVSFVNNNSFWKEQIQQFFVNANQDISFIPIVGNHEVILGDTSNLEEKFKKLETFYKKGLIKLGWNKYKTINLKYRGQIICKK